MGGVTPITSLSQFKELYTDELVYLSYLATLQILYCLYVYAYALPTRARTHTPRLPSYFVLSRPTAKHPSSSISGQHVGFYKVDVDEQEDIAQECGVSAMPTFLLFHKGNKIDELKGAHPANLQKLVSQTAVALVSTGAGAGAGGAHSDSTAHHTDSGITSGVTQSTTVATTGDDGGAAAAAAFSAE
ncbi:hypothetical protein D9758_009954 [Tetrapyrgos nigripes]|uniref:Thioredoxin domain-containing protein n=1 Tax=Tetrapyrgos nigripes TaxID=182062 RepID=A0A8H5CQG5_9AGAR|nr:hypothetical protein D9758_009954 [Tetrapyrgos nigripes]